jgi:hypothetical protein
MKPIEKDIQDTDTALEILKGWEKDVFRPDVYSNERLAKDLREHLRDVILQMENNRSLLCEIMGPVYPVGVEKDYKAS